MNQFPIIKEFNKLTTDCFEASHNDKLNDFTSRVGYWMGHKVMALIGLPLNLVAFGVGLGLTTLSASTLGAIKVFIFAITLGNIKPSFASGFLYFGEPTLAAGVFSAFIIAQVCSDGGQLVYEGYKGVKWVFHKLHLTDLFSSIISQVGRGLRYSLERVALGAAESLEDEELEYKGLPGLHKLENITRTYRIDFSKNNRPIKDIGAHYLLSLPSIPLHTIACAVAFVASIILCAAFAAKALVFAATDYKIPVQTGAPYALSALKDTATIAIKDTLTDIGDLFVITYKTSAMLGINRVAVAALDVLLYIPRAVFS